MDLINIMVHAVTATYTMLYNCNMVQIYIHISCKQQIYLFSSLSMCPTCHFTNGIFNIVSQKNCTTFTKGNEIKKLQSRTWSIK